MHQDATLMNYGAYGLKAIQPDRVISKQIEAARVALTRFMKRQGRVWTRIFPNIFLSQKNLLKLEWVKEKEIQNFGLVE